MKENFPSFLLNRSIHVWTNITIVNQSKFGPVDYTSVLLEKIWVKIGERKFALTSLTREYFPWLVNKTYGHYFD